MQRPLGILILSLICFLAAQGTGIRLFFHLFYILLALLPVTFVWAWLNLRGLDVVRETFTPRAAVGEHARERITIFNRWFIAKLWVEVQDFSSLPQHGTGFVAYLPRRQHSRWTIRTLCTMRGKFTLGPARLISSDPLGIFRLQRPLHETNEIIVYPQTVDLPEFTLVDAELPGGQAIRTRAYNVTPNVATIRDYVPGDSFNRIHWRSTARTGRLMVKEFELDPAADIYLVLDLQERTMVKDVRALTGQRAPLTDARRRFPWFDRPAPAEQAALLLPDSTEEYIVMAAASLARRLLDQSRVVGMIAWGQHHEVIPAEREERQLFKILEALAVLRAYGIQSLAETLLAESQRFSRNSTLIILTASLDERWPAALQQLLYRGVRAMVVFVDPQSFGGWHTPEPILDRLTELRILTYRLRCGQPLAEALQTPIAAFGPRRLSV